MRTHVKALLTLVIFHMYVSSHFEERKLAPFLCHGEVRSLKARLHRAFAYASPIDTGDPCKRFLHRSIQKNANARCKRAISGPTNQCEPV